MSRATAHEAVTTAIKDARRLDWDSEFFGLPVGQGRAETAADVEAVDLWAARERMRCLYLVVPGGRIDAAQAAEAHGFVLTGVHVTLVCDPAGASFTDRPEEIAVRPASAADVDALEAIAARSHGDTRFYADPNFSRAACERLYRTWIRRSCEGWADHVIAAERQGRPCGYVTLHIRENREGAIGLIAVADDARRTGVGHALVGSALRWFGDRRALRVRVVTQAHNVAAMRLYQRMGFLVSEVEMWLHKWL